MSREALDGAGRATMAGASGVVVVAHGGRTFSTAPVTPGHVAVLRMVPVAWAIGRALHGSGMVVCRPRFQFRGWNGELASPVHDMNRILDRIGERFGPVPVVLVGHSMGARAVLRAAGHPAVIAVAGLAPWLPAGEPVDQLAGRRVLLAHGTADPVTPPADTWAYAERARLVTDVAVIEVRGGEHAMLWRAGLWHRLAADFCRGSFGMSAETGAVTAALQTTDGNSPRTVLLRGNEA
jgi:pimeloyl-ACP methyl ester carboxylesterase